MPAAGEGCEIDEEEAAFANFRQGHNGRSMAVAMMRRKAMSEDQAGSGGYHNNGGGGSSSPSSVDNAKFASVGGGMNRRNNLSQHPAVSERSRHGIVR